MHIVQRRILDKLTYSESLRYSEMRPKRLESNLFAYHLKEIQKDGYVVRKRNGYTLSAKGKAHVDRVSHNSLQVRVQPKIVSLIALRNSKGEYLLVRRKHQPYIEMVGLPSGKLHLSESIADSAARELEEKTGVTNVALRHAGMAYVEMREGGEFISQILAHVHFGECDEITKYGTGGGRVEPFWSKLADCDPHKVIPGTYELIKLIEDDTFFFEEFRFDIEDTKKQ